MFAYCNNNPIMKSDPRGDDPVLFAAAGAALAGGLVSLYFYLNNTDDITIGGAILSITGGALAGALGGAASMLTGSTQLLCVLSASIVAGLISKSSGGSFLISGFIAFLATYCGLYIDLSSFSGVELLLASFTASLGTGFPAEMASQAIHEDLNNTPKNHNSVPSTVINSTPVRGGGLSFSTHRLSYKNSNTRAICIY